MDKHKHKHIAQPLLDLDQEPPAPSHLIPDYQSVWKTIDSLRKFTKMVGKAAKAANAGNSLAAESHSVRERKVR